jgi:hypothetical protein
LHNLNFPLQSQINTAENYILANPSWKLDTIPEIVNGKNIADFVDPDIAEKLEALEREEEKLEAEGYYQSDSDVVSFPSFHILIRIYFMIFLSSSSPKTSAKPKRPKSPFCTRSNPKASRNLKRTKHAFLGRLDYVVCQS